jgi:hypothetical protein
LSFYEIIEILAITGIKINEEDERGEGAEFVRIMLADGTQEMKEGASRSAIFRSLFGASIFEQRVIMEKCNEEQFWSGLSLGS